MPDEADRTKNKRRPKEIIGFFQKEILLITKKTVLLEQREQKANWNGLIRELVGGGKVKKMERPPISENESWKVERNEKRSVCQKEVFFKKNNRAIVYILRQDRKSLKNRSENELCDITYTQWAGSNFLSYLHNHGQSSALLLCNYDTWFPILLFWNHWEAAPWLGFLRAIQTLNFYHLSHLPDPPWRSRWKSELDNGCMIPFHFVSLIHDQIFIVS